MADLLTVRAALQGGMRFDVETGSGHHLLLDAALANGGENAGPRPMELLLAAVATCAGMDMLSILRKKRQQISGYELIVHGERAKDHPRVFTELTVEHVLQGPRLDHRAVQRALELTEEKYCGVSAMLKKTAVIQHTFRILEDEDSKAKEDAE